MKYLLDTNIIVDLLRKKGSISQFILEKGAWLSIISQAELVYGSCKSANPNKSLEITRNLLSEMDIEILNLNEDIIDEYGRLKAKLEMKGERLDDFDLLIAASAISEKLTLVTRNINHFERVKNLAVVSP